MAQADRIDYGDLDAPSSPVQSATPPPKRRRIDEGEGSQPDNEDDSNIDPALRDQGPTGPLSVSITTGSQNLVVAAKRYATKHNLTAQQIEDTQRFIQVSFIS